MLEQQRAPLLGPRQELCFPVLPPSPAGTLLEGSSEPHFYCHPPDGVQGSGSKAQR